MDVSAARRTVLADGRRLQVATSGTGPSVVLETGGGAPGVDGWGDIERRLSARGRVTTYDRAGAGHSDGRSRKVTTRDLAGDLAEVLRGVPGPHVLVGWSLGGLIVQLYAAGHPSEVAGLVLLDPTPTDLPLFAGKRELLVHLRLIPAAMEFLARLRVLGAPILRERLASDARGGLGPCVDIALADRLALLLTNPRMWRQLRQECALIQRSCAEVESAIAAHRISVPVVVVSAGLRPGAPAQRVAAMRTSHQRLALHYPTGEFRLAVGSSHHLPVDGTVAVVTAVEHVLQLAARVRST